MYYVQEIVPHKKRTRKTQPARKNELKFECYICRSTFEEKGQLRDHLGIHTGKQRHKCDTIGTKVLYTPNKHSSVECVTNN